MGDEIWYRPTKQEAAWLAFVSTEDPEPPKHRCGRCANPYTGGREDCPNNREVHE